MSSNSSDNCCCRCCTNLISLTISLGFIVLIYWLIFQPHQIRAYVDNATLSQFNLSSSSSAPSLSYSLSLNLSLRNPNKRIGVYYDRLSAALYYSGDQVSPTDSSFQPFFQHTKTTTVLNPVFQGQSMNVSSSVSETFAREKRDGVFNLEVKLNGKLRYKLWFVKIHGFKPKIDCLLGFPAPASGGAATVGFTKCNVDY